MFRAILIVLASFACLSTGSTAAVLFEGYFKIERDGKHLGYVVQRDEIDDTTKHRKVTYLVWETSGGQVTQDAVQVVAKLAPSPVRYSGVQFTNWTWSDDDGTVAVGTFRANELAISKTILRAGKAISSSTTRQPIPSGSIFSALSTITFAEGANVYSKGTKANYMALDEEDQKYGRLELTILDAKSFDCCKIAQVLSEMRNDRIELFAFEDGQPLGSQDSFAGKIVYLTKDREQALGEFHPADTIKQVFGDIPLGQKNPVSESAGKLDARLIIQSFASLRQRVQQPLK